MRSIRYHAALVSFALGALAVGLATPGCASGPTVEDHEGAVRETQQALSTCATLQRGTLGTVHDATIASNVAYPGWGATSVLRAGGSFETVLFFDIGSIPAGVVIDSATLSLFTTGAVSGTSLHAHALLTSWTEPTSSFPAINQQFLQEVAGVMVPSTPYTFQTMSIKPALVQAWLDGALANNGLLLETMVSKPPNAFKETRFINSEAPTIAMRPALQVCYTTVDHCESAPCQNGATCTSSLAGYSCACLPGFSGASCEVDIDDCAGNPCQHGASCVDGVNGYACGCAPGYAGAHCETDVDDCAGHPCQNGGVCSDLVDAFSCACPVGFAGASCAVNVDDCQGDPCQNGASCVDGVNGYACACAPGFAGTNCEVDVDDCQGNACQNGSTCIDGVNGYTCTCAPGFTGALCQIDINDCANDPCQNGGGCIDGVNGYACACAPGFSGANCQVNVNECAPNPCQNGGTCVDGVNGYTCQCSAGFGGPTCTVPSGLITLNPLDKAAGFTLAENNMAVNPIAFGDIRTVRATVGRSTGKWYWEVKAYGGGAYGPDSPYLVPGIATATDSLVGVNSPVWRVGQASFYWSYFWSASTGAVAASWPGSSAVMRFALDLENHRLDVYINATKHLTATNLPNTTIYPIGGTSGTGMIINFGATPFAFPVIAGYLPYQQ